MPRCQLRGRGEWFLKSELHPLNEEEWVVKVLSLQHTAVKHDSLSKVGGMHECKTQEAMRNRSAPGQASAASQRHHRWSAHCGLSLQD